MNRKVPFAPEEFYHVYNRGVEKRKIFLSDSDKIRFIALMFFCNNDENIIMRDLVTAGFSFYEFKKHTRNTLVDIGAYCLMPNHFHFLVREKSDNGTSLFMQKLLTAYTMYFNKKYDRVGALFSGRFQSHHADDDTYLKYLYSYIHLNPLKIFQKDWKEKGVDNIKMAKDFLDKYTYSSYADYDENDRPQKEILNKKAFPEYFDRLTNFSDLIDDSINYYTIYHPIPRSDLGK